MAGLKPGASDGSWSLGYREWSEATQRFAPPQPAVGSLLQRGGGRRSGFRYFDAGGAELVPTTVPIDVRQIVRVRTTALARVADRLRVPAVLASPWIPRGTIDDRVFEHASIPNTVTALFAPGHEPRSLREKDSTTFQDLLTLPAPRGDNDTPTFNL